MNFTTGQVVVHPHHGPATVKKISTRVIRSERTRYLRLDVYDSDLSVELPVERAEEIGVRPVIDRAQVRELVDVLLAPSEEQETVWSRRIKSNAERLRTGDVRTIACLIRDLTRQNAAKRLSFGENTLLRDASGPFLAELALALSTTPEKVGAFVDAAILEGAVPDLPDVELATAS